MECPVLSKVTPLFKNSCANFNASLQDKLNLPVSENSPSV